MGVTEIINKIDKLKNELDKLEPLSKEKEVRVWQRFSLEWNYNSNSMDGNTLTYDETGLLLFLDKTRGEHEYREYREMKSHDVAIKLVRDWAKDKEHILKEHEISILHKVIMVKPYVKESETEGDVRQRRIIPGKYKKIQNSVTLGNGQEYQFASPENTQRLMENLMEWYDIYDYKHPILLASDIHHKLLNIHPFDDGNGRVARLLDNYILMKNGFPPVIIKSADKDNYLKALRIADSGEMVLFYEYMAQELVRAMEMKLNIVNNE